MLNSRISLLALVLAVGTNMPVMAQDATEAAEGEAPAQAAEAPANVAADLNIGQEANGESGGYVKETFGAWQQRCMKTGLEADPCQLYTLLKDGEGNNVAEFTIFNLPEGTPGEAIAGANFIAPLETLLGEGVRIQIDTAPPLAYPFSVCTQVGCVSRIGFTKADVAALKKGKKAVMTIVPFVSPETEVKLEVSLQGFTAAYEAVEAQNKLADAAAMAQPAPQAPAAN